MLHNDERNARPDLPDAPPRLLRFRDRLAVESDIVVPLPCDLHDDGARCHLVMTELGETTRNQAFNGATYVLGGRPKRFSNDPAITLINNERLGANALKNAPFKL